MMNDPDIKIENGQVWRRGSTEGIPTWVSTTPLNPRQWWRPKLKPLVMAIRMTLMW
jgi:hypothetical protein